MKKMKSWSFQAKLGGQVLNFGIMGMSDTTIIKLFSPGRSCPLYVTVIGGNANLWVRKGEIG
jgi:hypothetical protein